MKDGPWRYSLRHFAPNDSLGVGGILHLVADGDLLPQGHQPTQVLIQRLGRHPREGHTSRCSIVSRRERQSKESGSLFGVLEEEFVKVADSEEDESIPVLGFDLSPLAHQWGIVSLWHCVELQGLGHTVTSECVRMAETLLEHHR